MRIGMRITTKNAGVRCRTKRWILLTLIGVLPSLAFPLNGSADAAGQGADVMMVLDLSGSMQSRGGARRYEALFEWMNGFTTTKDRVGVVAMGYGARLVSEFVACGGFSLQSVKKALIQREKFTDVAAGLESAYYQLKSTPTSDRRRIIILYSDAQIDMPGGPWASQNAMRYIVEKLMPAMKEERIQIVAVVPSGLKANFQLLHQLSSETSGAYYRGLPADASAVRREIDAPVVKAKNRVERAISAPITPAVQPVKPHPSKAETKKVSGAQKVVVERVVQGGVASWMVVLLAIFGVAILAVLGAVVFLFRSTRQHPDTSHELVQVLEDMQSLRRLTANKDELEAPAPPDYFDDEKDTTAAEEEADEALSLSTVSPFLEYEDTDSMPQAAPADEIASKPAFDIDGEEDPNLSLSTMETLIGGIAPDVEKQNE
jgi:hypothetical protein